MKKFLTALVLAALFLWADPARAAGLVFSNLTYSDAGSERKVTGTVTFDDSYLNNGEAVSPRQLALSDITTFVVQPTSGFLFQYNYASDLLLAYNGAGFTPAGTNTALNDLDISTPLFTGTGQSSSGQVITTTENKTMSLNQCAGMFFISATHGPYLIASNTAVAGAPAVLTIYGTAPTTDAGTWKILSASAQTFAGVAVAEAALSQVDNGVNLSAVAATFVAYGRP